jgi:hypothetical protein
MDARNAALTRDLQASKAREVQLALAVTDSQDG